MKMMTMMKNMMKNKDSMDMMPKDKEQAMKMNQMMQMDKSKMNAKMGGMMSLMMKSGMMEEMMGEQMDLTMGNGNSALYVEHTQGFLKYKEGM